MGNKDRILIIDDEEVVLDSCTEIFAGSDYQVATAMDGAQGLELLEDFEPDLIFVDLMMPGISGIEVLERVHATDPTIVTVVITGYATVNSAVEAMKHGAYDFLPKPFTPDEFRLIARRALETVKERIRESQFKRLVSEGLAAFHRHEYQLARSRLVQAKRLKPNSREVADALAQVEQAAKLARIAELQKQALAAEQREDWQVAFKSYQTVVEIDPNVQFAGQGRNRAAEQIRIARRLDFFLNKPEALESDKQLKNAGMLIAEAMEIEPRDCSCRLE